MRQGSNNQSNRRGRGRGHNHARRNNHHGGHGHRNQNFDSNGPSGRIRGNAKQVYEKYLQLAKDAISSGDRVLAESLFQHADHYGRIAAQFAPKPKPEETPAETSAEGTTEDSAPEGEAVTVEIESGDAEAPKAPVEVEAVAETEAVVEEKPKRRAPRRAPTRKKVADDAPKLGGGTNAVPDFLARPVDVEGDTSAEEESAEEEKPKRRTTRRTTTRKTTTKTAAPKTTRTRRKKADADAVADSPEEKEAS